VKIDHIISKPGRKSSAKINVFPLPLALDQKDSDCPLDDLALVLGAELIFLKIGDEGVTAGKLGVVDWVADSARSLTPLGKRADGQNSAHCSFADVNGQNPYGCFPTSFAAPGQRSLDNRTLNSRDPNSLKWVHKRKNNAIWMILDTELIKRNRLSSDKRP